MVHLSAIPHHDGDDSKSTKEVAAKSRFDLSEISATLTTSVYGSRFAGQDLPKNRIPETEMPKEVAYRMIKDELSLDNNPMLKYVTQF